MDFVSRYKRECLLKGTSPLHAIESSCADAILNFKFLRIPASEWNPILSALRSNYSVKKICVTIDVLDFKNPMLMSKLKHLHLFNQSLVVHLSNSRILNQLFLVGIPFSVADVEYLTKGIVNSNSIEHLCLAESKIGDEGLIKIIEAIKTKPNIVWLDLRSCDLSSKVGKVLASLVSFQSVARENAARKACLSDGDPNLDLMRGLRRFSLSGNALGDAAGHLALALHGDRWINAVDLQFCNLKDIHVNQLIRAAERNDSLVHLDTSNNVGLNTKLVKRLKELLEYNSLKHPFVIIQPIANSASDRASSNHTRQKVLRQDSPLKDIKLKTKTKNFPVTTRHATKDKAKGRNDELSNDMPSTQLTHPSYDIFGERMLQNNAEMQITQIHDEFGSVKARIAILEMEVRELGIKNTKPLISTRISTSAKIVESEASSRHLTGSVLMCMRRLQDVLKELKMISAVPHHCEAKARNQEIQMILDAVYAAVRQFDPQANRFISEKYMSVATDKRSFSGFTKIENYEVKRFPIQGDYDNLTNSIASCHQKVEGTENYRKNSSGLFHKYSQDESVTSNKEKAKTTKAGNLTILSGAMSLDESLFHEQSTMNVSSHIMQDDKSIISLQDSSRNTASNHRVSSLKDLQTNLEELRQQLVAKNDDTSSDKRNLLSGLTVSRCDFTSQEEADLRYSTCFDSFSTSSASDQRNSASSIGVRTGIQNYYLPPSDAEKSSNFCFRKDGILSSRSSTIDLSSIVNLLGNFSVDDIGSSTLTPP